LSTTYVIPDRERWQNFVILSLQENTTLEWLVLDSADATPSEQMPAEYASTSAREKCQLIHSSLTDEQNVVPEHAIRRFGKSKFTGACPVNISVDAD